MIANANSIVQLAIQIKNGIMKHVNVIVKIVERAKKKNYSWNPSTCICENGKYLKSIVDDSKIVCDKIRYVMNIVSTNVANIVLTNVSTNSDGKKVRN